MFESIIGNEPAKSILRKTIEKGTLANTMLFHGIDGVGKSLFAKELAKELILDDDLKGENKIEKGSHPDFHNYLLDNSNTYSIQTMRSMIEEVYKPPYEGKAKVFVINDAEKMLESSANAILKTLEEPNLDSYIILLSSKPNELLPTIQSRCFKINFTEIETNKIKKYLVDKCSKSEGMATYIAKMAAGSIGKAHLLANNPNVEGVIEKLLDLLKNQYMPSLDIIEEFCRGFEALGIKMEFVFSILLMWFRDQTISSFYDNAEKLFFKDDLPEKPIPVPLENIHYYLENARKGIERNLKVSNCLHNFFLEVYSRTW